MGLEKSLSSTHASFKVLSFRKFRVYIQRESYLAWFYRIRGIRVLALASILDNNPQNPGIDTEKE